MYRAAAAAVLAKPEVQSLEEDLEVAVFRHAEATARHRGETLPGLWGEAAAALALGVFGVLELPLQTVGAVAGAAIGGGLATLATRVLAERAGERAWNSYSAVVRHVLGTVQGRVELAAHDRGHARAVTLDARLHAWRSKAVRSEWTTGLASRGALAAALLVGGAIFLGLGERSWRAAGMALVLLQPMGELLKHALEERRWRAMRGALDPLLALPPPRRGIGRSNGPVRLTWDRWSGGYADGGVALSLDALALDGAHGPVLLNGPNGSGKSTLVRALALLLDHSSGTLAIGGVPIESLDASAWRQRIAYLPQRPYLPKQGTIREALAFLGDATDDAMRAALARVELEVALEGSADALSAGQRQRLALARMLLRDADVVLLDEPDQNLDRKGLAVVVSIVRELAKDRLVIVAAHDAEVLALEGRHLTLENGRLINDKVTGPASADTRRSAASA